MSVPDLFMKLLLFLFVVFVLCFIYAFVTRKWANKYKLIMVFGKKGSGKSCFLMREAIRYMKKGFTVYTNMADCMLDGVRIIDPAQLGNFVPTADSLLLLDEVGMLYDNRNFKNFKPEVRDFFKLQRHYKVVVIMNSQSWDIDKKLRDLTDQMYLTNNIARVFSLARKIDRKIVLTESTSEAESRISENLKFSPIWDWKLLFIPRYAKLFQSFVVPVKPELPYSLVQIDRNNS